MEQSPIIGIDVSQAHLDVHVRPTDEAFRVSYDDAGLTTLLTRLQALGPTLIVFEATGGYEVPLAATLASAELPLAIVNPRQIRQRPGHWPAGQDGSPRRSPHCSLRGGRAPGGPRRPQ